MIRMMALDSLWSDIVINGEKMIHKRKDEVLGLKVD